MVFAMDALTVEAAPHALYEVESAAYYRRFRAAVAVTRGLSVAFAHAERPTYRPTRAEHDEHVANVAEFARLARKCLESNASWQPTGMYLRWLAGRGVRWAEVAEQLASDVRRAA